VSLAHGEGPAHENVRSLAALIRGVEQPAYYSNPELAGFGFDPCRITVEIAPGDVRELRGAGRERGSWFEFAPAEVFRPEPEPRFVPGGETEQRHQSWEATGREDIRWMSFPLARVWRVEMLWEEPFDELDAMDRAGDDDPSIGHGKSYDDLMEPPAGLEFFNDEGEVN
jgi:hypothetical protein